jgi:hypothetical protein
MYIYIHILSYKYTTGKMFLYSTFNPQTARKSSLHGLPVIDRTVNGIGADASL